MADLAIAAAFDAIAAVAGDRRCICWRDRTLSWREVASRTDSFARGLLSIGVERRHEADIAPWESPHDHVALYLTNGNEYLEAMLGSWKARAASININYRYTPPELAQVLNDAAARVVVYHRRFGPTLAAALASLDRLPALVVVDDGSDEAPIEGAIEYEALLVGAAALPQPALPIPTPDDRYVVYTGGTTGRPKGVLWRQGDFLSTALGISGDLDDVVARAQKPNRPVALPAPPFMHGAAHWNALSCLLSGGTVVIQDDTERFDPADVLAACDRHGVGSLLIVGDAFARPLLRQIGTGAHDLSTLRMLMTGGAVLSPSTKADLLAALPSLRIIDVLGSSETGRHGMATAKDGEDPEAAVFEPSDTTVVLDETRTRRLQPGETERGWLAQVGRVPLGYLGDPTKTSATFPEIDGKRHAVAGDRARLRADGRIELLGRDSVTINTGGEKVHAEEVEQVLKGHASIDDALVVGRPSERWGSEVVAVVALRPGMTLDVDDVLGHAAGELARYKLPKVIVAVDQIARSASGKPDYAWARAIAAGLPA